MIWTDSQLAYLAGIIDGEGSFYIGICRNGRSFMCRIYVVNTNKELVNWLKETFGGLIYSRKSIKNPQWKIRYEWVVDKPAIDPFCKLLLPFLIIKKKHAEIMIEFRNSFIAGRKNPISDEILAFRTECYKKIKALNHRSSLPVQTLASGYHALIAC